MNTCSSLFLLLQCIQCGLAYRILAVIPFSGKSHYLNMQPIIQELSERGHDVTVIATFREENVKYTQIVLERRLFWEALGEKPDLYALNKVSFTFNLNMVWNGAYFTAESAFNSTKLQDFIKNDNSHFDLIFTEIFYLESFYMFSYKYNAPIVGFSTMGFAQFVADTMGSPLVLSYMIHEHEKFGPDMNLIQKLSNLYSTLYDLVWRHFYLLPKHQRLAERHFGHLPQPLPKIEDIERNMSAVLLSTHFSSDMVRPYVPGVIEVGGVHIKQPKKLPEILEKYLNESKDGAIFFSFGSNVQGKDMPKEKREIFLKCFGKLNHRVLWKWEDDSMPGQPDNVLISKWLPQNDILAHPNVKLFITHGGMLSTLEATARGVPIIGMPLYGDQHLNVGKMVGSGLGVKLAYADLTEESLDRALQSTLNDPKYANKAKEISYRFNDRPMSPLDTAIYWIEYVIRHKGASFMKSPVANLSRLEYHIFELGSITLVLLSFFGLMAYICSKFLIKLFTKNVIMKINVVKQCDVKIKKKI